MKLFRSKERNEERVSSSEPLSLSGDRELSQELADELAAKLASKKPTVKDYLYAPIYFLRIWLHRLRPQAPPGVDEYGIPSEWRIDHDKDPGFRQLFERSSEHWPIFEKWCESYSVRAFPAEDRTVLGFILDPPVKGPELYEVWFAIRDRHEAIYWHDDVCPYCGLTRNHRVYLRSDGAVEIPDGVLEQFDLSFLASDRRFDGRDRD